MTARRAHRGRRARSGLSLIELMVAMLVLGLLATALVSILRLCLQFWTWQTAQVAAEQNARVALTVVTAEVRQGLGPPGQGCVLVPSRDGEKTGSLPEDVSPSPPFELRFTEPASGYDPLAPDFDPGSVARRDTCFKTVRYFLSAPTPPYRPALAQRGNVLVREQATGIASGDGAFGEAAVVVASSPDGRLDLLAERLSGKVVRLVITAQEPRRPWARLRTTAAALVP